MQMLRFLRRVFIILILLIIVFFIFRFIKPEATSRFVDKVKNIPTTISNWFHREKKSEIIINGNTTSTSSNFEINENNDEYDNEINIPVVIDEDNNEIDNETVENEDNKEIKNSWLEELNKELDKIMASGNNIENTEMNNLTHEQIKLIHKQIQPTQEIITHKAIIIHQITLKIATQHQTTQQLNNNVDDVLQMVNACQCKTVKI